MKYGRLKLSLFLNFALFSVLMSSDGILILQVQKHYAVAPSVAGILGGCRDISVAVAALLLAAYVARIGYKRSMMIALGIVTLICAFVPIGNSFLTIELLFVSTGVAFALIKSAIFSSIGLVAHDTRTHASFMSYLEATYAFGTFAGYFVFSAYSGEEVAGSTGWLQVYYLLAGASILCMAFLWIAPIDESEVHEDRSQPLSADFIAMLKLAATAVAGAFAACIFTYDFLAEGINKWLPTFNSDVLHIPVTLEHSAGEHHRGVRGDRPGSRRRCGPLFLMAHRTSDLSGAVRAARAHRAGTRNSCKRGGSDQLGDGTARRLLVSPDRDGHRTHISRHQLACLEFPTAASTWRHVGIDHALLGSRRHRRIACHRQYFSELRRDHRVLLDTLSDRHSCA